MGVYPNLESFLKFNITQYVYLIQDIKTNTLINLYISSFNYRRLIKLFRELKYNNQKITKEYYHKLLNKVRIVVLEILDHLVNNENYNYTWALIITEQINADYSMYNHSDKENIESDSEEAEFDDTENDIVLETINLEDENSFQHNEAPVSPPANDLYSELVTPITRRPLPPLPTSTQNRRLSVLDNSTLQSNIQSTRLQINSLLSAII